ncbi:MAG: hypothetical protein KatS3mg094_219 [Candidatus Parcubacteria bacterium]|nr:MAG: hypothetical protein KatS3mg094_219 [Candidatus Parcubacteria bacterium]
MGLLFKLSIIIFILALITFAFSYYFKNYYNLNETYILDSKLPNSKSTNTIQQTSIESNNQITNTTETNQSDLLNIQNNVKVLVPIEDKNKKINSNQNNDNLNSSNNLTSTEENISYEYKGEVIIKASEFKFEPNIFRVKEGQKVKLIIKNEGKIPHNLKIEKENIVFQTSLIGPNEESILEFTTPPKGEYDFYCTLDDHKLRGMFGKMIVE